METVISDLLEGDQLPLYYFLKEQIADACSSDIDALLKSLSFRTVTSPILPGRTASRLAGVIAKREHFRRIKVKLLADCRQILRTKDFIEMKKSDLDYWKPNSGSNHSVSLTTVFVNSSAERWNERNQPLDVMLKMSLLSVDKRKHLPKVMELVNNSFQDETRDMALKALLMLYNSHEPELIEQAFTCLLYHIDDPLPECSKIKIAVLLHRMITKLPSFWNRLEATVMSNIVIVVTRHIASAPVQESSSANLLALFAMLDPDAEWLRRWLHSYACRKAIKPNLGTLSSKVFSFLNDSYKCKRHPQSEQAFLLYSGKQIHHLLYRYYCLFALTWLKYNDLFNLYITEEWIQILGLAIDYWMKKKKEADLYSVLFHLATCENAARFLLDSSCIDILKKLQPSAFIKIIWTAFLHNSLDATYKLRVKKEILCYLTAESSETTQFQTLLSCEDSTWHQLLHFLPFIDRSHPLGKCEFQNIMIDMHNLCSEHSVKAFLGCTGRGIFVLPEKFLIVNLSVRQLLIDKLNTELICRDLSTLEWDLDRPEAISNTSKRKSSGSFKVLVSVFWQPSSAAQLLHYIDCNSYFRELFRKIRESGDSVPLRKMRILTVNLDVAYELRYKANLLQKIKQCYVQWAEKNISDEGRNAFEELTLLYSSLVIGGPSEIQFQFVRIDNATRIHAIVKQLQAKHQSADCDRWPETKLLEEATAAVDGESDEGIYMNSGTGTNSIDNAQPVGHPLVQHFDALFDYAYYLKAIPSRKYARRQITSLRIPYFKDGDQCDWFHAALCLIFQMNAQLVNSVSFKLYHHRSVNTFWPSANGNYPAFVFNRIYPLVRRIMGTIRFKAVRRILKREGISSFHLLLLCCNQVYLNFLDWPNVKFYVAKSVADGPRFQAKHFCAVLLHLEDFMLQTEHRGRLLAYLSRAAPLSSFRYLNYDSCFELSACDARDGIQCCN